MISTSVCKSFACCSGNGTRNSAFVTQVNVGSVHDGIDAKIPSFEDTAEGQLQSHVCANFDGIIVNLIDLDGRHRVHIICCLVEIMLSILCDHLHGLLWHPYFNHSWDLLCFLCNLLLLLCGHSCGLCGCFCGLLCDHSCGLCGRFCDLLL